MDEVNSQPVSLKPRPRMGSLDLFRIFSALMIVLYHSISDFGCDYAFLTPFIAMGSIFMTAFFILSGFCIHHSNENLDKRNDIFKFYLKRILAIFPLYYVMIIINLAAFSEGRLEQSLIALPMELLGLQMIFPDIVNNSINGGLWFISCVFICYLLYPLLLVLLKHIKTWQKLVILAIIVFALIYSPVVQYKFDIISLYHHPLYRFGEFIVGVVLSSLLPKLKELKHEKWFFNYATFFATFALLVIFVYLFYNNGIQFDLRMYYEVFTLPLFGLMVLILSGIRINSIDNSKVIKYIASICYALYLVQIPLGWTKALVNATGITNNIGLIFFVVGFYLVAAVVLHELVERPVSILRKRVIHI